MHTFDYLNGAKFCMVYMNVLSERAKEVKLTPVHGVARVLSDRLVVEEPSGRRLVVPDSALSSIAASDGTELLKDAEYYVIVKISC